MSKKSIGIKIRIGFDNAESLMYLFDSTFRKIRKDLIHRRITTGYKLTGIEIVYNQDFSQTIMFNFDNELSIEEIIDKAITG